MRIKSSGNCLTDIRRKKIIFNCYFLKAEYRVSAGPREAARGGRKPGEDFPSQALPSHAGQI
jgi:hypothetical protein